MPGIFAKWWFSSSLLFQYEHEQAEKRFFFSFKVRASYVDGGWNGKLAEYLFNSPFSLSITMLLLCLLHSLPEALKSMCWPKGLWIWMERGLCYNHWTSNLHDALLSPNLSCKSYREQRELPFFPLCLPNNSYSRGFICLCKTFCFSSCLHILCSTVFGTYTDKYVALLLDLGHC